MAVSECQHPGLLGGRNSPPGVPCPGWTGHLNWVYNLERALAQTLEQLINARGQQLRALVDTYKALGGGWNLEAGSIEPTLLLAPENELPKPKPARIDELPLPSVRSDG